MHPRPTITISLMALLFSFPLLATPEPKPIQARTVYFSQCSDTPFPGEECLQFVYHENTLLLIHHNAFLNCAAINSELTTANKHGKIEIIETSTFYSQKDTSGGTATAIMACSCYFTIAYEIKNLTTDAFSFTLNNKHSLWSPPPFDINLTKTKNGSITLRTIPAFLRK